MHNYGQYIEHLIQKEIISPVTIIRSSKLSKIMIITRYIVTITKFKWTLKKLIDKANRIGMHAVCTQTFKHIHPFTKLITFNCEEPSILQSPQSSIHCSINQYHVSHHIMEVNNSVIYEIQRRRL